MDMVFRKVPVMCSNNYNNNRLFNNTIYCIIRPPQGIIKKIYLIEYCSLPHYIYFFVESSSRERVKIIILKGPLPS